MSNTSKHVGDHHSNDHEGVKADNSGRQFASGGAPGLEMGVPASTSQNPPAEFQVRCPDQQDFLMIQLSSFEEGPITESLAWHTGIE